MTTDIELPRLFRKIIAFAYNLIGFEIIEAYVDEQEHKISKRKGLKGLRAFLGVTGNESICDCFCKVRLLDGGKIVNIILENKTKRSKKSLKEAKKQLEITNNLLKKKKGIKIDFAVVCRLKMEPPYKSRQDNKYPFKRIYVSIANKNVYLEGTSIPLLSY